MATGSGKKMGNNAWDWNIYLLFTMNYPCQMGTDGIFDASKNGFCCGGLEFTASIFIVEIPRGMGTLRFKNVFKWSERFLLRLPIGIHGNIPLSA